jgi:HTH-type transcriptional regulator, sugar sensing transcriptional regulator
MELTEALVKTGLTGQEALLYLALCREGQMTGYEAAKVSGISRSNAYLALSGLVDKGGAWRVVEEPASYVAVPPAEYLANVRRAMEGVLSFLEKGIPGLKEAAAPFITVRGKAQVIDKMRNAINETKLRVYLSLASPELELVRKELEDARSRGIKTVIITDADFALEGAQVLRREKKPGQIRLICDTERVLTGELSEDEASCLYSRNTALIQLIKDSLTNEMELIRLSVTEK